MVMDDYSAGINLWMITVLVSIYGLLHVLVSNLVLKRRVKCRLGPTFINF